MAVLPRFVQPFLTWLTGKPLSGEKPWRLTLAHHFGSCLVAVAAGVSLAGVAAVEGGWWLLALPPAWLLTTHGVRKLRSVVSHQCAHSNFSGNETIDTVIGEMIAIVFMTQNYLAYKAEHVAGHHSKKHMTMDDPTVAFILLMVKGRVGMSKDELWRRLLLTIFSPWAHLRFLWARFRSNFLADSKIHVLLAVAFWAALLATVAHFGVWKVFLLAWVVPLTVILHPAECLRLCGKHVFPENNPKRNRETLAGFTNGIFVGERFPSPELPLFVRVPQAIWWFLKLFLVHLPARMLVLVGDAPCHDYHHRFPNSPRWTQYLFARAEDSADPQRKWPDYTEVWGVTAAVDATFESMAKADPTYYDVREIKNVRLFQLLEGLEE